MRLKNKVAIITGGGSGIGRATALLFAREGAKVVVSGRRKENIEETVSLIKAEDGDAHVYQADISRSANIKSLVEFTLMTYKKIDILFNNAAVGYSSKYIMGSAVDTPEEDFDAVIAINLKSVFMAAKYVIPYMIEGGAGSIINCSSINGVIGCGADSYTATKGGIIALTRSLAVDNARFNIRVNTVSPGVTDTPMIGDALKEESFNTYWTNAAPLKRVATPEEVAYAVLFFASEESSFITGQNLVVDGGLTIS